MTDRDELLRLLDDLPDADLGTAERMLHDLQCRHNDPLWRLLDEAPIDDEPTTPEEEAAGAEARAEIARGEVISADEAKRHLLG